MKYLIIVILALSLYACVHPPSIYPNSVWHDSPPKTVDPYVLELVNVDVNTRIVYEADAPNRDFWQPAAITEKLGTGDCEDYAILKSSLLPSAYSWNILLVYDETLKQQHAVLLVDDKYVLDNNYLQVYFIGSLPYKIRAVLPEHSTRRPKAFSNTGDLHYD